MTERTPLLFRGSGGGCNNNRNIAVGNPTHQAPIHYQQQQQHNRDAIKIITSPVDTPTADIENNNNFNFRADFDNINDDTTATGGTGTWTAAGTGESSTAFYSEFPRNNNGCDFDNDKRDRRSVLGRFVNDVSRKFRSAINYRNSNNCNIDETASTATAFSMAQQPTCCVVVPLQPIVNNDGEDNIYYYEDPTNEESFSFTCGTSEKNGIWLNLSDQVGTLMSVLVWLLFGYSCLTVTTLAMTHHTPKVVAYLYVSICTLALMSHVKTTLSDPGSVPSSALPLTNENNNITNQHTMCSICQTYKPVKAHHCRICNRCISRME